MKMVGILRTAVAGLVLCAVGQQAQAVTNCTTVGGDKGFFGTMALQISSLTVPRDAPVGTILYTQRFEQAGNGMVLECDKPSAMMYDSYYLAGMKRNTGVTKSWFGGVIFETGVPGIGVAWWPGTNRATKADTIVQYLSPLAYCIDSRGNGKCLTGKLMLGGTEAIGSAILLIKTGQVGTGTIRGADLGTMRYEGRFDDSRTYLFNSIGVRGDVNVVASTCTTPDVRVPLGKHMMSSLKGLGSGQGSSTPAVPFTIALTGCPGFPGLFGLFGKDAPAASESAATNAGTLVKNTVSIQLDSTAPIDAAQGILSLTGPTSASGVGVQLLDEAGAPVRLLKSKLLNLTLAPNTVGLDIKFSARYVQTANNVLPGKADAVATYTLTYQ